MLSAGINGGVFLEASAPGMRLPLPVAVGLERQVDEFVDDHAAASQCSVSLDRTHGG